MRQNDFILVPTHWEVQSGVVRGSTGVRRKQRLDHYLVEMRATRPGEERKRRAGLAEWNADIARPNTGWAPKNAEERTRYCETADRMAASWRREEAQIAEVWEDIKKAPQTTAADTRASRKWKASLPDEELARLRQEERATRGQPGGGEELEELVEKIKKTKGTAEERKSTPGFPGWKAR